MGPATSQTDVEVLPRAARGQSEELPPPLGGRLLSLDVFRGATIGAMILVNNAGDAAAAYWPLKHARWNGWTPTDLIFPFFLFMVGVSMVFSFCSRRKHGEFAPAANGSRLETCHNSVRHRSPSERLSEPISSGQYPNRRRSAAYCALLPVLVSADIAARLAWAGARYLGLPGWLLGVDALCSGAGVWCAHSRYSPARSEPQPCRLARPQALYGSSL